MTVGLVFLLWVFSRNEGICVFQTQFQFKLYFKIQWKSDNQILIKSIFLSLLLGQVRAGNLFQFACRNRLNQWQNSSACQPKFVARGLNFGPWQRVPPNWGYGVWLILLWF